VTGATLRRALIATSLLAASLLAAPAAARAQASLYVPLDDIAYRYADALIARGELQGVSLLERPYTAAVLAAGADTALGRTHSTVVRSYAIALRTALQRYVVASGTTSPSAPGFLANADVFATATTSGERELMQADTNRSLSILDQSDKSTCDKRTLFVGAGSAVACFPLSRNWAVRCGESHDKF